MKNKTKYTIGLACMLPLVFLLCCGCFLWFIDQDIIGQISTILITLFAIGALICIWTHNK